MLESVFVRMQDSHVTARKVIPGTGLAGRLSRSPTVAARPIAAPIRVLGIDPGTLRLGYGVVEHVGPGRLGYVECGVISAPATLSRIERLGITLP